MLDLGSLLRCQQLFVQQPVLHRAAHLSLSLLKSFLRVYDSANNLLLPVVDFVERHFYLTPHTLQHAVKCFLVFCFELGFEAFLAHLGFSQENVGQRVVLPLLRFVVISALDLFRQKVSCHKRVQLFLEELIQNFL